MHGSQALSLPIVDFVFLATGAYALVGVFSRGSLIWLCREDDGCGDADDAADDGDEDRLFERDEVEDVNHGVSFVSASSLLAFAGDFNDGGWDICFLCGFHTVFGTS